jgi:hypothetical protein
VPIPGVCCWPLRHVDFTILHAARSRFVAACSLSAPRQPAPTQADAASCSGIRSLLAHGCCCAAAFALSFASFLRRLPGPAMHQNSLVSGAAVSLLQWCSTAQKQEPLNLLGLVADLFLHPVLEGYGCTSCCMAADGSSFRSGCSTTQQPSCAPPAGRSQTQREGPSCAIASMQPKVPLHTQSPVEASMGLGWLHYSMCITMHTPDMIPTCSCSCRMCGVIGRLVDTFCCCRCVCSRRRSGGHWEAVVAAVILSLAAVRHVLGAAAAVTAAAASSAESSLLLLALLLAAAPFTTAADSIDS